MYGNVALADPDGAVLLTIDPKEEAALTPEEFSRLWTALVERRPILSDLYRSADEPIIHLDVLVPLFSDSETSGEPLAAVVMSASVENLFAIIRDWPIPSDSGEILLVRREGDNVLFSERPAQATDAALNLAFPLSRTDLGAVAAVLGRTGIFEGKDYRGADIVAALRSIPDSPWFMVAKMDKSEAYAGGTTRFVLILALAIVVILAVAAAAWMYWQFGQKRHYREAYERESERLALLSRFEHLMKLAGDAILVNDEQSRIVEANDGAVAMYGYSREEMLGLHVIDLVPLEGRVGWETRQKGLREKGSMLSESVHMRKDGTRFPVEVSIRGAGAEGGGYTQAIIRDITQRKLAEAYREASREVLQILNQPRDLHDSMQSVLAVLKTRTDSDAVGIRLQDGDDFPYFAQEGFSKEFLLTENTLTERAADGGVCRDEDGNVSLECTCGLVISGKTDPSNALFTPGGSFWTNDSMPLLDLPSDQDPRLRPRNQCMHHGYASMALVPIRDRTGLWV